MKKTIFIVEDHDLMRELWRNIYVAKGDLEVVGVSGEAEEAMKLIEVLQPDIISLDINLGMVTGFELVPRIRQCSPHSKIIVLSMHVQQNFLKDMEDLGVHGYVTKSSSHVEVFKAIDEVLAGRTYVCSEMRS
ncbi:MAG: hypothetical protein RIR48_2998 [Bacteroidota bacterium]